MVTAIRRGPAIASAAARRGPAVVVGLVSFIAIRSTLLPGVDFWDTAELQTVGPLLGTAHPTGFPTYVLLGWLANILLAPFGEPALRMNLLSALCVAAAAAATVGIARTLTGSTVLGVLAGLGLALTDLVWSIGTHAEAHSLHLLLVAILLRLLIGWEDRVAAGDPGRDRWLVAAAAVFGLSMGNHSLTLLLAPAIGLFVIAVEPDVVRRGRLIAACVAALLGTAALVFLELPLRAGPFRAPLVYGHPETWDGFWEIVLAEQFRGSLVAPFDDLPAKAAGLAARTVGAFGILAPLVPVAFLATALARPRYALLSGVAVAVTVFFAASYENADIGRYYLVPVLFAWTWLAILAAAVASAAGSGAGRVDAGGGARVSRAMVRPDRLVALLLAALLLVPTGLAIEDRARRVDRSQDRAGSRWLDRTLSLLAPDAVVVSWWSYSTPLWYGRHVEGRRPDISIVDDRTRIDQGLGDIYDVIDANLDRRPVYVIRADPREVADLGSRYVLDPIGGPDARFLTRVVARRVPGA